MNAGSLLRVFRNKFMQDTATLQASAMLNQASQLLSSVLVANLLGAHGHGLLILSVTLHSLFYNLINVGVVQATIAQVAAATARDNEVKVAGWLAFLVKCYLLFSALMIVSGYFVLPFVAEWWYAARLGPEEARRLGVWAWWLCFWPLIDTPRAVAQVAFQSTRRMLLLGKLDNGCELFRMFLVTAGVVLTGSPVGGVIGEIVSRTLGSFLGLQLMREAREDDGSYMPSFREVLRLAPRTPMAKGIRLGVRVGLLKNGTALFMDVFPGLILGAVAGASWVAYFRVATKIVGLPMMLLQGVTRTVLPALSELRGVRDLERFRRLYFRTSLLSGATLVGVMLASLPLIHVAVAAFWPSDFADPVFRYACILALGLAPFAFAVGLEAFYILTDQMKRSLMITAVGALITIPTNVVLIVLLPETGAAWGLALYRGWVLVHLVYVAWYFRHRAGEGHWDR